MLPGLLPRRWVFPAQQCTGGLYRYGIRNKRLSGTEGAKVPALCFNRTGKPGSLKCNHSCRKRPVRFSRSCRHGIFQDPCSTLHRSYGQKFNQICFIWKGIIPFFIYLFDIKEVIYTTDAVEWLDSVRRKAIKNRRIFPQNDTSALKVIVPAVRKASERWSMPVRNWKPAINRFLVEQEDRFAEV